MLYIAGEPASNAADTNLWITRTDPRTGAPIAQPRRLSDLVGFSMRDLSVPADGKTATVLKHSAHVSVFVGNLQEGRLAERP